MRNIADIASSRAAKCNLLPADQIKVTCVSCKLTRDSHLSTEELHGGGGAMVAVHLAALCLPIWLKCRQNDQLHHRRCSHRRTARQSLQTSHRGKWHSFFDEPRTWNIELLTPVVLLSCNLYGYTLCTSVYLSSSVGFYCGRWRGLLLFSFPSLLHLMTFKIIWIVGSDGCWTHFGKRAAGSLFL